MFQLTSAMLRFPLPKASIAAPLSLFFVEFELHLPFCRTISTTFSVLHAVLLTPKLISRIRYNLHLPQQLLLEVLLLVRVQLDFPWSTRTSSVSLLSHIQLPPITRQCFLGKASAYSAYSAYCAYCAYCACCKTGSSSFKSAAATAATVLNPLPQNTLAVRLLTNLISARAKRSDFAPIPCYLH
jgi:hypothetical protein